MSDDFESTRAIELDVNFRTGLRSMNTLANQRRIDFENTYRAWRDAVTWKDREENWERYKTARDLYLGGPPAEKLWN